MKSFFFVIFISSSLGAANTEQVVAPHLTTFNQIVLSEGATSWTSRDLKLYKKLIKSLTKKDRISDLSKDLIEDFMISRLLRREAVLFEIQPNKLEIRNSEKAELAEFSKSEISAEIAAISYAAALLNLKETQMSQQARFKAWIDVLKRKYAVKIKMSDLG